MTDYDDPKEEERWCEQQRRKVEVYLAQAGVLHREVGEWPAWHIAPYVSIWAIESMKAPGWVGWWVISGDGPTDYVSSENIKHPRDAMRAIGQKWKEISEYTSSGHEHPSATIGSREDWPELAPLLAGRATMLLKWADDESIWGEAESENRDPYWKLQPQSTTPEDEICKCQDMPPLVLQDHLSPNPLACLRCNGEVPPQRIDFPASLSDRLATWKNFHRAFYVLWLDSAEYEKWAAAELENPKSPVNVRGLQVVKELNKYHRTYYWWFQDASGQGFVPIVECPSCSKALVEVFGHLVCETCSIIVPNG